MNVPPCRLGGRHPAQARWRCCCRLQFRGIIHARPRPQTAPSGPGAERDATRSPRDADFIGEPQAVIDKILMQHASFGNQRCLLPFSVGAIPHKAMLRAIELYGNIDVVGVAQGAFKHAR
jgi:hypothetical protein